MESLLCPVVSLLFSVSSAKSNSRTSKKRCRYCIHIHRLVRDTHVQFHMLMSSGRKKISRFTFIRQVFFRAPLSLSPAYTTSNTHFTLSYCDVFHSSKCKTFFHFENTKKNAEFYAHKSSREEFVLQSRRREKKKVENCVLNTLISTIFISTQMRMWHTEKQEKKIFFFFFFSEMKCSFIWTEHFSFSEDFFSCLLFWFHANEKKNFFFLFFAIRTDGISKRAHIYELPDSLLNISFFFFVLFSMPFTLLLSALFCFHLVPT